MTLSYEVLVPAYQAEDSIAAAVASALAQEPAPLRVLVHSDGSTDATVERARAAGAEVVDAAENRGVGAARQALLERARAPWVLVLDSDDRLLPGAAGLFAGAVAAQPDAWVLGFGEVPDTSAAPDAPRLDPARPVDLRGLWQRNPFVSSSTLVRREPAVRVGGFPAVRRLVDYAFWLVLAGEPEAGGRLWNRTVPVTARAVHGGTITGNVVAAVQAERDLLVAHADAALAGLPGPVRTAATRVRLAVLWWRGLSRHRDYGRPSSSYLPAGDVVPGVVLPGLLGLLALPSVQRTVRAAARGARGALHRAAAAGRPPVARPAVAASEG
ncbi:Glycosyltransferase involved in cell wall bisynthesis [Geodermatophilus telluris]|uniref:4,4'-diaponeurosporenoate glycosyltransferase n=1 Tax=Geodermatophilus telluris TaxID=1190417 RepID=A0A1G6M2A5_9ACTN|nr:glycosyltransferase family 2 protein [Geodermatophilus telluris]SDC49672.1 Glycosyltransferase involved in cell wall bisynthesis [Geodermatophilus telluris]